MAVERAEARPEPGAGAGMALGLRALTALPTDLGCRSETSISKGTGGEERCEILAVLLVLCVAFAAGCGATMTAATPEALKDDLPQGEDLGLETEREFEWDNATDYSVQGPVYSEGTKPSEWIDAIENAGFEAGAGAMLVDESRARPCGSVPPSSIRTRVRPRPATGCTRRI